MLAFQILNKLHVFQRNYNWAAWTLLSALHELSAFAFVGVTREDTLKLTYGQKFRISYLIRVGFILLLVCNNWEIKYSVCLCFPFCFCLYCHTLLCIEQTRNTVKLKHIRPDASIEHIKHYMPPNTRKRTKPWVSAFQVPHDGIGRENNSWNLRTVSCIWTTFMERIIGDGMSPDASPPPPPPPPPPPLAYPPNHNIPSLCIHGHTK